MTRRFLFVALLLGACSNAASREKNRIMDTIEAHVQMPSGAHPINEYARYYAWDSSGRVFGVYTTVPLGFSLHRTRSGQRTWVRDTGHLPNIVGGGCETVNLVFNPATRTFGDTACNGSGTPFRG